MIFQKKYFSIAEASEISALPAHKLRYIEKSDANVEIIQIRGRRYYTKDNIDYIKAKYSDHTETVHAEKIADNSLIISRIDQLLAKFHYLLNV